MGTLFSCYGLFSPSTGRAYIGMTTDTHRRVRQHRGDLAGGARATRVARDWQMVFALTGFPSHRDALRAEWRLKHPQGHRRSRRPRGPQGLATSLCTCAHAVAISGQWTAASTPARAAPPLTLWLSARAQGAAAAPGWAVIVRDAPCVASIAGGARAPRRDAMTEVTQRDAIAPAAEQTVCGECQRDTTYSQCDCSEAPCDKQGGDAAAFSTAAWCGYDSDGMFTCDHCGRYYDGNAQCPCGMGADSDEEGETRAEQAEGPNQDKTANTSAVDTGSTGSARADGEQRAQGSEDSAACDWVRVGKDPTSSPTKKRHRADA